MYKIGVDITTISRIKNAMEKESFRKYVFTENELKTFYDREKPKFDSLAANFAAKEAVSKALGTGIREFTFNEIEILRDELGCPYFNFYGKAFEKFKDYNPQVSLSHEGDTAIATVILEKNKNIINL